MPTTLFKLARDAPVASAEDAARFMSELKSVSAVWSTKPTAVMASMVNQTSVVVEGTVLSSEDRRVGDKGSPTIGMKIIVEKVKSDSQDGSPADDLVSPPACPFSMLLSTKVANHPDDAKVAMPRVVDLAVASGMSSVKLAPLVYVNTSYFKGPKDDDLCAASVPSGTRVRLTGVMAKIAAKTGTVCINIKKFNVIDLCDNPVDAHERIAKAMNKPLFLSWQAMETTGMVGGIEHIVKTAPVVGSDIADMIRECREGVRQCLDAKSISLAAVEVGKGGIELDTQIAPHAGEVS